VDVDDAAVGLPAAGRLHADALFPCRGDRWGEAERVDPGMAQLKIPPEQPAEGVGQPDQADVVDADLAFPQIVDQQIAHRPALEAAAIDQLLHAELPPVGQRPHGRRGGGVKHAECVQQLVEVRALVAGEGADVGGDLEQFQAVADGDVSDHAALGHHEGGDPVQRHPGGGFPDRIGLAARGQVGESGRVTGAGHLRRQPLRGGRGEQPGEAGADHIGAHQRQQAGAEHRRVEPAIERRGGLAPPDREASPVDPAVIGGAAGQPPLLPGVARLCLQPVHDEADAPLAVVFTGRGVHDERRRPQLLKHRLPGQPGLRPGGGDPAGREPRPQRLRPRPGSARRRRRRRPPDGQLRAAIRTGRHHRSVPNKMFNDSGRYRGGGGGASGC